MPVVWLDVASPFIWVHVFFALTIGHALGDFALQSEFMARGKNRHLPPTDPSVGTIHRLWIYCLASHCLVHAGLVWLITGSALLGFIELLLHCFIDWLKIERKINFHIDQALHLICKAAYACFVAFG